MTVQNKPQAGAVATAPPPVQGLHHYAYKCRDPEETRAFWEDLLGLPLVHVIEEHDAKITTGETVAFAHFFFQMRDGSYVAFFDLGDGKKYAPDPATPLFVNHLALRVESEAELLDMKRRLEGAGHPVIGPLEHDSFVRSIYFWDPNGIRAEFAYTTESPQNAAHSAATARERLDRWVRETSPAARRRSGGISTAG